jgi:hypothetical protein
MKTRLLFRTLLAAAAALLVVGCASSTAGAPQQNPVTGAHPADWLATHFSAYTLDPASCLPCHGSAADPTQAGGTSQVSCFGCHHPNGPNHPANWADRAQHGRLGAQAPYNSANPLGMMGFASCTPCHGANYVTPIGAAPSCETAGCHPLAPHGIPPWGAGVTPPVNPATSADHDQTDPSNAAECYKCHAYSAAGNPNNPPNPVPAAPAPGAAPSCFNNTLCHGLVTNP